MKVFFCNDMGYTRSFVEWRAGKLRYYYVGIWDGRRVKLVPLRCARLDSAVVRQANSQGIRVFWDDNAYSSYGLINGTYEMYDELPGPMLYMMIGRRLMAMN